MDHFRQRLCFSTPTISDVLLDYERKNEIQDFLVFFGANGTGNTIILCVNQTYKISNSFIYFKDQNGIELIHKETDHGSYGFSNWKTPSLQFQCVVPMQTWRIIFSGNLRNKENYCHHVKINFLHNVINILSFRLLINIKVYLCRWKPFGFPVYCNNNNEFFKHEVDVNSDIFRNLLGFDQFGLISGTMSVNGQTESMDLRAIKLRRWNMMICDSVFVGLKDYNIYSAQNLKRINCTRGHLKTISEHEFLTSGIRFPAEISDHSTTVLIQHKNFNVNLSLESQTRVALNNMSIETIFGDGFKGILLCFRNIANKDMKIKSEKIGSNDLNVGLTVDLNSELCTRSSLVGNKAKSLYLLKKAIADGLIDNAIVPDGLCITTVAMRNHITQNEHLMDDLNRVIQKTNECDFERLSDHCERLKERWLSSKTSDELFKALSNGVDESSGVTYAVRSSSPFEDDQCTSSAGQYVTKLGSIGVRGVTADVLECWSSNFSARALTYRKNNGQPLMCDMAVVVQRQVRDGRVAGVAFTRNPNTGDPDEITVAASYGPGENVVSGSVEPHSAVLSRRHRFDSRTADDVAVSISDFNVEENDYVKSCISEELLKKLAKICVQVERAFGLPQDIEWAATAEDRIYLLQSRPITSIFTWTADEIVHEFDSPLVSEDVVMFYNVKEVYPNPMHPLSLTLDFFSMYPLFKLTEAETTDVYRSKQLCYTNYNLCLNVCQMFQDLVPNSMYVKIIEYSIAGKSFLTSDIWGKIALKNNSTVMKKLFKSVSTFKEIFYLESRLDETNRLISEVNFNLSDTLSGLLSQIDNIMNILEKVSFCHAASSMNNIVSHTLLVILGFDFNESKTHSFIWYCSYAGMGAFRRQGGRHLLPLESNCRSANHSTVESLSKVTASVKTPDIINVSILRDIQNIANTIYEMPTKNEFCDLPVEDCYDWLKSNCEKGHRQIEDFIKKYGHRGVQELDFGSETWSTDSNRLFLCLRALLLADRQQVLFKPTENHSSTVSRGYVKKMVFDFLLKRYRKSITHRERSKDMLVLITHKLRLCYRKLGDILVDQGRIPDARLIFFMSQYETRNICEKNCPEIVHKALKRRKLWPTLCSLKFDDVCYGRPVPTDSDGEESIDSLAQLNGCCVFPGKVKSRACVLDHIEDAHSIRPGDVLIVKSVDIAWSPYFPICSGLVTEIGGIISHGAVVAREYGLPCLVGVQNVKKHFKTGDIVVLDSEKGFVIKDDTTN